MISVRGRLNGCSLRLLLPEVRVENVFLVGVLLVCDTVRPTLVVRVHDGVKLVRGVGACIMRLVNVALDVIMVLW